MHDGDTSLDGLDDTETSEKSVEFDVRGDSGRGLGKEHTCVREIIEQSDTKDEGCHKYHELSMVVYTHW